MGTVYVDDRKARYVFRMAATSDVEQLTLQGWGLVAVLSDNHCLICLRRSDYNELHPDEGSSELPDEDSSSELPEEDSLNETHVLEEELATFEQEKKRLLREHRGKFVLIHGSTVMGIYETQIDAIDAGLTQLGPVSILTKKIAETEQPARIYSIGL